MTDAKPQPGFLTWLLVPDTKEADLCWVVACPHPCPVLPDFLYEHLMLDPPRRTVQDDRQFPFLTFHDGSV